MSDAKISKNDSKTKKKSADKEIKTSPDAGAAAADKGADKSDDKSSDQSANSTTEKSGDSKGQVNKSASQTSISHFSSVSTEEYRSGWANIFGNTKSTKKTSKHRESGQSDPLDSPLRLKLYDEDITDDLRVELYKAFQRQARKDGIGLVKLKKIAAFEYTLECRVSKK
jgi:hypothetical protein